jgi:hypothetical protein
MQNQGQQNESILIPKIDVSNKDVLVQEKPTVNMEQNLPKQNTKTKKIIFGILIFFGILIIYSLVAGLLIYRNGMKLYSSLNNLSESTKTQDFTKIKPALADTKTKIRSFESSTKLMFWAKVIPFAGSYVADIDHLTKAGKAGLDVGEVVLNTIEPFSDLLGIKGGSASQSSGEKTTQERIDFIVNTIPSLLPKIDEISGKTKIIQDELSQINPDKYPEKYKTYQVRSNIKMVQDLVNEASMLIVNGKPLLESTPYLLGMDSPRNYLIIFQNDKELRPTGGFLTGYAIVKVDKAKFEPALSDDIYNLDAKYRPSILAPDPLIKYIKGPYVLSKNLRLRDMNWSPDFQISMDTFNKAIKEVGVNNIDGIISVDTRVLENLLSVIGPIGVPGYGNFSTKNDPRCNCPQVIYELESYADVEGPIIWDPLTGKIILKPKNADNRKKIIGPLMNSILANALGQPKEKLPDLFQAAFKSLTEKHVLLYLLDSKVQTAVADFGLGGVIKDYNGDYLHINDANLGGRKSNLYATEEVLQDINVARDGSVTKTVTITYKNPEKQDGWLNSVLPTWVRVYVPKGSTLITSEGLESKAEPYEDLGKTVFAGFFQLRPEGVSKVTFQYKLPFKVSKNYKLLIQKQPGTDGFLYTIKLGKHEDEFYLTTDKEIKIGI